jgi:subtilisin family serine protease
MRHSPLVLAVTLGLGLALPINQAADAAPAKPAVAAKSAGMKTYIVTFQDAPLAMFKGSDGKKSGMPKMAATSPLITKQIKYDDKSAASGTYRKYLQELRANRLDQASAKLGRKINPDYVYDVVLHGFAAKMTESEAAQIRSVQGVKQVEEEVIHRQMSDRGPAWIKADQVWAGGGTPAITGNRGAGIIIGVIDSGINRTHPSFAASGNTDATFAETFTTANPKGNNVFLGHCSIAANAGKCNNKLIGIWDFIAGGTGTAGEGNDESTGQAPGHGTHTAATAAGNTLKIAIPGGLTPYTPNMSGVAPRANIIAYKACNSTGCPSTATVAATNQAVIDGVTVISYSIGGGPSTPFGDADGNAFLAARAAGVVISAAAGNDGPSPGTLSNPSNSPWVMSVAATTHDRSLANTLVLTGGNTPRPGGGTLFGAGNSSGTSTMPAFAIKRDPAIPLCAVGSNSDDTANGTSSPPTWGTNFFVNTIGLCQRGFYARLAKANNVRLAGGSGMILYNQASEGDSTVPDAYSVPTVHLNFNDGQSLLNWLNTGTGHTGQLLGASYTNVASSGDRLASFSGRGPVVPTGVVKPDIAAPGVAIYAAGLGPSCFPTSGTDCVSSKSGTSMATPHVSGAAALVKAVNPSWNASQIISSLILTARPSVTVNGVIGTPHDQGAGQTDVSKAVRAGLYLNATEADFRAADAANSSTLNLPSIASGNCFESCAFTRTFTDMVGGGAYTIVANLPAGATVTNNVSNSLSFTANQARPVTFTFNVSAPALLGKWVYGSITLQNTSGNGRPNLTLPVAIRSSVTPLPDGVIPAITQAVTTERGFFDQSFTGLAALPDARFIASDLLAPTVDTPSLAVDPTPSEVYDGFAAGIFRKTVVIPASPATGPVTYRIIASTSSATSPDVDLSVGLDSDGDGLPEKAEEVCVSAGNTAVEECELTTTTSAASQTYWILAQNFTAGSSGTDVVRVDSAAVPALAGINKTMTATGPGRLTSGAAFRVRMAWDDPSMVANEKRFGFLLVQGTNGKTAAEIPVTLTRTGTTFEPYALVNNVDRAVTLPAGATHDKLYFDVPPNATSVTFTATGAAGISLGAARLASPTAPIIEAAPSANAFTANAAGTSQTLTISGANLQAGRWYVKPANTGAAQASINVKATIAAANAGVTFKPGSYYNSGRSGHGVFIYPGGPFWGVIWYTYLQDGTPTWYYIDGRAPGASGIFTGSILRGAWNGTSTTLVEVGTAKITITSANTFRFDYNLDGQTGSEPMETFVTGCPVVNGANLDVSAHWYNDAESGYGYSVQVNPSYEFIASFVYDGTGYPRFLLSERGGAFNAGNTSIPLSQASGFCPLCPRTQPVFTTVGNTTRTYGTNNIINIGVNATFANGVPGTWNNTTSVVALTGRQGCNP